MAGFERLIVPALNHLIQKENWAKERLQPFSGAQLQISAGSIHIQLSINGQGLFALGGDEKTAYVVLTLPSDVPSKLLFDRDALFASVKLSGSADLAESLAFVFRNLSWDIEEDLASVLGDIPARRLAITGAQLGNQLQNGVKRIAENIAEFATEDSNLLAPKREIAFFCQSIDQLRDDAARLEKRIKQL
jgi:ubiquinone biosynthesis protein UbiJ